MEMQELTPLLLKKEKENATKQKAGKVGIPKRGGPPGAAVRATSGQARAGGAPHPQGARPGGGGVGGAPSFLRSLPPPCP